MVRRRYTLPRGRYRFGLLVVSGVAVVSVAAALAVTTISVDRVEAVWMVDGEVGEQSQTIPIRAAHPQCPSWSDLGGLVVTASETDDAVTLTATFPEHDAERECQWLGNSMPSSVRLETPLGDRALIDGATGQAPASPAAMAFHTGQSPRD